MLIVSLRVCALLSVIVLMTWSTSALAQASWLTRMKCTVATTCFYVVQKPMTVPVTTKGKTSSVNFKSGQVVSFRRTLLGYKIITQERSGGAWVESSTTITPPELETHFRGPFPSDGDNLQPSMLNLPRVGPGIKMATTPSAVGNIGPGEFQLMPKSTFSGATKTVLDATRLVNFGIDGKPNWVAVQHVCFDNTNLNDSCKWVRADQLKLTGSSPVTASMNPESQGRADHCTHPTGLAHSVKNFRDITAAIARLPNPEVKARNELMDHVGTCAYWPPKLSADGIEKLIRPFDAKDINLYDAVVREKVLQEWKRISPPSSNALAALRVRSNGKTRPFTRQDFVKMDVLARTIYGESRNCADQDGHLEATARTMINRVRVNSPKNFEKGGTFQIKNTSNQFVDQPQQFKESDRLIRVVLSDKQYSVWNNANEVGGDLKVHLENSRGSFCPSINSTKGYGDNEAWAKSVAVAMHAVLDPDLFLNETKAFEDLLFYTSPSAVYTNKASWKKLPTPTYRGKKLNEQDCMVFFADKTKNYEVP